MNLSDQRLKLGLDDARLCLPILFQCNDLIIAVSFALLGCLVKIFNVESDLLGNIQAVGNFSAISYNKKNHLGFVCLVTLSGNAFVLNFYNYEYIRNNSE